jgi:hypothetical protein
MQRFPIPWFASYDGKTAKFGHRTWEKSQHNAAQLRMLNEILRRCSLACGVGATSPEPSVDQSGAAERGAISPTNQRLA